MRGKRKPGAPGKGGEESDLARALPCDSPLHAIPDFERISVSKIYPRSAVLFVEGQTAHGVYVLCTGRAKVSISSAEGKKLIIRIAQPGDVLELHAGLGGGAYGATAEMLQSGRVDFAPRKELLGLLKRQNSFGLDLVRVLSREISECVDHARLLLLSGSAVEKLARLILKWNRDFGERTTGGVRLRMLLTQEEIAQIIGASRETVTRLLGILKRKQIIRVNEGAMLVRNRAALASLANLSR